MAGEVKRRLAMPRLAVGSPQLAGWLMAVGGSTMFSFGSVWLRRIMEHYRLSPLGTIFWRDVVITALLLLALAAQGGWRIRRQHLLWFVLFGVVGIAINNGAWGYAISLNGVTIASVIAYTSPAFTVLLARPIYGETISRRKALALTMALGGCLLVSQVYNLGRMQVLTFGLAMAIVVTLTQASRDLIGRTLGRLYPALTGMGYSFLIGTFLLGVTQAIWGVRTTAPIQGWLELIGMSACIAVGYVGYLGALRRLPAGLVAILTLTEAVVSSVLAHFIYGERLAPPQLVGALLVLVGVALLQLGNGQK